MIKKKLQKKYVLLVFIILSTNIFSNDKTITANEIIKKANYMSLYQGSDSKGKIKMIITDKNNRIRTREFNILRKDSADNKDQKYFVYFKKPADVRKMVFIVHKHYDINKEDDRWLYMPGLDLVKRIAGSDKRTSFAGSDFLYEDISGRNPNEDKHVMLKITEKYYVIKNVPLISKGVEFKYYIAYISKTTFLPMKVEYYKNNDQLYSTIKIVELQKVKVIENKKVVFYNVVKRSISKNIETGSETEMIFSNLEFNIGVKENYFSERYLRKPPRMVMR